MIWTHIVYLEIPPNNIHLFVESTCFVTKSIPSGLLKEEMFLNAPFECWFSFQKYPLSMSGLPLPPALYFFGTTKMSQSFVFCAHEFWRLLNGETLDRNSIFTVATCVFSSLAAPYTFPWSVVGGGPWALSPDTMDHLVDAECGGIFFTGSYAELLSTNLTNF